MRVEVLDLFFLPQAVILLCWGHVQSHQVSAGEHLIMQSQAGPFMDLCGSGGMRNEADLHFVASLWQKWLSKVDW